ncbi:MAG: ATP-binding domain-containing protein, partial [Clostridia bacterium]|nr:ATP-binding domain-containing protein [Clostridia bacterium]
IFAVGDEDQCIYSWRGAKFTNVRKFIDDNEGIAIYKLEQNYRSTSKILDAANRIIKNNSNRLEKNLWTENDGGSDIKFYTGYSDHEEAEFVASKIKKMVMEDGKRFSDFAVLMRVNALSRVFEEKFLNYQIPYQVYGGFKFFERKEVKDTLAYLKLISNPKDNDSFIRVLAFPKKGIGEATIKKLLDASSVYGLSAFEVARTGMGIDEATIKKLAPVVNLIQSYIDQKSTVPISILTNKVVDECCLKTAYSREVEEELSKIQNIEMLQKSVLEYEEANEEPTLEDYLQSVTLSRDIDEMNDEDNNVSIMTIHSAKGLEFPIVFVVGLVEGILPTSRSLYSSNPNDLEEERRLMYVATTRAKEELIYTRPTTRFSFETKRTEATTASRFLKESGIKAIETTPRKEYGSDYSEEERFYSLSSYRSRSDNYSSGRYLSSGLGFNEREDVVEEEKPKVTAEKMNEYKKFKVGTVVSHKSFGKGVVTVAVTDPSSGFVTIKFDNVGIKTLSLKFAPLTIVED